MSYLINGADVRYFFNTSICGPSTFTSEPETPVFGGEVKMFVAAHNTEEKQGQMTFSQVQYIDENRKGILFHYISRFWTLTDLWLKGDYI